MMNFADLASAPCDPLAPFTDELRLAVAAYLARFKDSSRYHTDSDLRCYLSWCSQHRLDPLAARRPHLELYIRWMQEIRRFKPSTVSRRFSVAAGFYRTCVIDGLLEHSPAEHVRRPSVPAESPTLGFTHLQFEALLTAARESSCPCDFALVAMLGLLGLRIFEATSADITDLGEEHGHRVLRVCGKGTKVVLIPLPPAVGRAIDKAIGSRTNGPILLNSRGARMDRHAATRRLRRLAQASGVRITSPHPHMLRHTFVTTMDAGVDLRDVQIAARHADLRTTMRYDRARKNLDRHPNYILAAYMASGATMSSSRSGNCGSTCRAQGLQHPVRPGQLGGYPAVVVRRWLEPGTGDDDGVGCGHRRAAGIAPAPPVDLPAIGSVPE
jgi:integrase/recombinase XerD